MANPAYSLVSVRGNYFIQDTNTNQLYSVDGSGRGIVNKQQLLQEAVNVLNQIGEQVDLSQVRLMRDGVHIEDRVINPIEIQGYERSYARIEESYSQTVSHSNHVAARVMSESSLQMGASDAARRGELSHEEGLGVRHDVEHLPDAQTPEAAKSALASIAKFFSRLKWPNFLVKVGEVFEKIFSKGTFVARHQNRAKKFMDPTQAKIDKVRQFEVRNPGDKYAYVPKDIILSQELREERDLDHKIGGQEACPEDGVVEVADFISGSHTVTGYGYVVGSNGVEPGAVVPTSTRYADDQKVSNHLTNCYVTHSKGAAIIRTGVIDTPEKAAEFESVAKELHKQMGRPEGEPVRVMSHQLNSPEREDRMIKGQHKHLLARKSDSFQAGHLNAPNNRFYHHHKTFKGVPIISDFLSGEKKSHEQNVEGMVQYLAWIVEDLQKNSDPDVKAIARKLNDKCAQTIIAKQVEVDKKFKEITELESKIDESDNDDAINDYQNQINQKMQEIDNLRTQMIHGNGQEKGLKELHKYITQVLPTIDLKSENIQANPNLKTFDETLNLFGKLLGSQLEIKGGEIDRNQEHLMLFALDKRLGVISAINCKSGLDRTGILFALFLSAMDLPEDKVMDIALNWETYSLALNKLYKAKDYDADLVYAELSKMGSHGQNLKTLFDMQHNVLQHLLKVSLPITGLSTGIIGLKYQKGIAENLLPLYCLPPVVKTEEGNIIRLFTYDSKGKPKGLTDEGHALGKLRSSFSGRIRRNSSERTESSEAGALKRGGSLSRIRRGSSSVAARISKSRVDQTTKTENVAQVSAVQLGAQDQKTFKLAEAISKIGNYEQYDKPPVDYDENDNPILFTEYGVQVTYDSEKGGFVNSDGNHVEVTKDDKNNLKLFNNDQIENRTQIPCDKTGKPDPKGFPSKLPKLNQEATKALFKDCNNPPTDKRRLEFMAAFQAHLRDMPPVQKEEGQDNPVTNLLDFFGGNTKLLDAYKAAVKEERNSEEFRKAVFIKAADKQKTNPCPGQKMVMYIGGPSAAGKSFTRGAFVEKVREIKEREGQLDTNETKDDNTVPIEHSEKGEASNAEDCFVVSVDGGIDREMCQIRQMVLQAALVKGHAGIEDLHKHTKTSVKGFVKKAAMAEGNNMHVVIPATFISGFQNFVSTFRRLSKKDNFYQVFAEVRADHTGNIADKNADESFRETIRYNGESRAYLLQGDPDFDMDTMHMNNRSLPCESKVYEPKHFGHGVTFSKRAKYAFKLVASSKRSIILSNESDNMHVDSKGSQTTEKPAVKHISRREVNLWRQLRSNPSEKGIKISVKLLGLSDEKTDDLIEKIRNGISTENKTFSYTGKNGEQVTIKLDDLKGFRTFLSLNGATAPLKVTESRI